VPINVQCPVCANAFVAEFTVGQKHRKMNCTQCKNKLDIAIDGNIEVFGPRGCPPSPAEDLRISEDRVCGECRYYHHYQPRQFWITATIFALAMSTGLFIIGKTKAWIPSYWPVVGTILSVLLAAAICGLAFLLFIFANFDDEVIRCTNKKATAGRRRADPDDINPNQRCKFWKK
jgi:hypothetical protein